MQVRRALWLDTFLPNNSTASAMFSKNLLNKKRSFTQFACFEPYVRSWPVNNTKIKRITFIFHDVWALFNERFKYHYWTTVQLFGCIKFWIKIAFF